MNYLYTMIGIYLLLRLNCLYFNMVSSVYIMYTLVYIFLTTIESRVPDRKSCFQVALPKIVRMG